jgi:hypothetical protein
MADIKDSGLPGINTTTTTPLASTTTEVSAATVVVPERTGEDEAFLFKRLPGTLLTESKGTAWSWVWKVGYDVSRDGVRFWVCLRCVQQRNKKPATYNARNLQNVEYHLLHAHRITDPSRKRASPAVANLGCKKSSASKTIATYFQLDASDSSDQMMANRLISAFDRTEFQRRIVRWLVNANLPFRTVEHPDLRDLFSFLNPSVEIQHANLSEKSVHAIVVREFERHKGTVVKTLRESPGQVHLVFDGWTSRNRLSLYGVSAVFRDSGNKPHKIVLGLPEMEDRHTGEKIAEAILEVIYDYEIHEKVGYFTVDNATNNDAALKIIGEQLGFRWEERRVRCFGHIINLVVKAMLFGSDADSFEQEVSTGLLTSQREHEKWRQKGPIGKLHNFCQVSTPPPADLPVLTLRRKLIGRTSGRESLSRRKSNEFAKRSRVTSSRSTHRSG